MGELAAGSCQSARETARSGLVADYSQPDKETEAQCLRAFLVDSYEKMVSRQEWVSFFGLCGVLIYRTPTMGVRYCHLRVAQPLRRQHENPRSSLLGGSKTDYFLVAVISQPFEACYGHLLCAWKRRRRCAIADMAGHWQRYGPRQVSRLDTEAVQLRLYRLSSIERG